MQVYSVPIFIHCIVALSAYYWRFLLTGNDHARRCLQDVGKEREQDAEA